MNQEKRPIFVEKMKKVSGGIRLFISTLEEPLLFPVSKVERDNLREGQVLTPELLLGLQMESERYACGNKAAALFSHRDYSIGQFKQKLKIKNFGEGAIQEIVHKYKAKGLLDDRKYAAKIVEKIIKERPSGKPYLIAALRRKLIPRDLADEIVDTLFKNEDAVALAVAALKKKWRQFSQFEVEEARTKSYNYLSRRGFGYGAARSAFETLWQNKQDAQVEERED